MTKIVYLPSHLRVYTKNIKQPLLSKCKVFNKHLICGTSFVALHPASINKLESPFLHQLHHNFLLLWRLLLPPPLEEPDVGLRERLLRILSEVISDTIQYILHSSFVVVLCCQTPSRVLMRMRDDVEYSMG